MHIFALLFLYKSSQEHSQSSFLITNSFSLASSTLCLIANGLLPIVLLQAVRIWTTALSGKLAPEITAAVCSGVNFGICFDSFDLLKIEAAKSEPSLSICLQEYLPCLQYHHQQHVQEISKTF